MNEKEREKTLEDLELVKAVNEKEKALEDLKLIKAVMEVANQTMARAGIPTILFGAFWLLNTLIIHFPGVKESFAATPRIFVPLWIGFVVACTIFLMVFGRRYEKQVKHPAIATRYVKQLVETAILIVGVGFVSSFLLKPLELESSHMILFLQCLVLGLGFYFVGVAWAPEFRIVGLFLFGGMIAIPYCPGYEYLIQGLTFGLGMILTGCFMHRRWLRLRREEKSIDVAGDPLDVEGKD